MRTVGAGILRDDLARLGFDEIDLSRSGNSHPIVAIDPFQPVRSGRRRQIAVKAGPRSIERFQGATRFRIDLQRLQGLRRADPPGAIAIGNSAPVPRFRLDLIDDGTIFGIYREDLVRIDLIQNPEIAVRSRIAGHSACECQALGSAFPRASEGPADRLCHRQPHSGEGLPRKRTRKSRDLAAKILSVLAFQSSLLCWSLVPRIPDDYDRFFSEREAGEE